MSESHAPLAEADLTQVTGLTLEDLTRLHESNALLTEAEQLADTETAPEESLNAVSDSPDLRQCLSLELAGETYQLDQQDDLRYFQQQAQQALNQDIPALMAQLGRYLHAQEQLQILYDRLAVLSEQRGAASDIMQLARQIESFEKQVQQERFDPQLLARQEQGLAEVLSALGAYRQILQKLQALV